MTFAVEKMHVFSNFPFELIFYPNNLCFNENNEDRET